MSNILFMKFLKDVIITTIVLLGLVMVLAIGGVWLFLIFYESMETSKNPNVDKNRLFKEFLEDVIITTVLSSIIYFSLSLGIPFIFHWNFPINIPYSIAAIVFLSSLFSAVHIIGEMEHLREMEQ